LLQRFFNGVFPEEFFPSPEQPAATTTKSKTSKHKKNEDAHSVTFSKRLQVGENKTILFEARDSNDEVR